MSTPIPEESLFLFKSRYSLECFIKAVRPLLEIAWRYAMLDARKVDLAVHEWHLGDDGLGQAADLCLDSDTNASQ